MITTIPIDKAKEAVETQQAVEDAASGWGRLMSCVVELSTEGNDKVISLVFDGGHWSIEVEEDG